MSVILPTAILGSMVLFDRRGTRGSDAIVFEAAHLGEAQHRAQKAIERCGKDNVKVSRNGGKWEVKVKRSEMHKLVQNGQE